MPSPHGPKKPQPSQKIAAKPQGRKPALSFSGPPIEERLGKSLLRTIESAVAEEKSTWDVQR